ncbi:hypothetical protein HMPREF9597_00540 [Cutibacterium acnes HL005PA4]|nr:hypothetical protein HMPREF9597_00540 [Cutibacterium acnes HL005PA4]EGF02995.1 hypothetical protein HMPREF9586_00717 [Cutibacterium acnes HL083PA2]
MRSMSISCPIGSRGADQISCRPAGNTPLPVSRQNSNFAAQESVT